MGAGEELGRRSNIVLDMCCQLGTRYCTQLFAPASLFIYEKLLECLRAVRDVEAQPGARCCMTLTDASNHSAATTHR